MTEYELVVLVTRQHIGWSRHTGHANDPLSIALRRMFGISKHTILFSLGGKYHQHKRLTVTIHDIDSPFLLQSYELSEYVQTILWSWMRKESIQPFKCKIRITQEQRDIIVECQRRNRLQSTSIDQIKPITTP